MEINNNLSPFVYVEQHQTCERFVPYPLKEVLKPSQELLHSTLTIGQNTYQTSL